MTSSDAFAPEPEEAGYPPPPQRPIADLLADLANEVRALAGLEIALFRAELAAKLRRLRLGLIALAIGAFLLVSGWIALLAAATLALATVMRPWLAALIVGLAALLAGGLLLAIGKKCLDPGSLAPRRTLERAAAEPDPNRGNPLMAAARRRSITEIESEIARSRAGLDLTLDALAVELAPKHLVEKAADMVTQSLGAKRPGGIARGGGRRADPVPLALIGLGAAWLVAENTGLLDRIVPGRGGLPHREQHPAAMPRPADAKPGDAKPVVPRPATAGATRPPRRRETPCARSATAAAPRSNAPANISRGRPIRANARASPAEG